MMMTMTTPLSRKHAVQPVCDAKKTFSNFQKKRIALIKENFNKLATMGTMEVKLLTDTMKELDQMHKMKFEEFMKTTSASPSVSLSVDDSDVVSDEGDNIFKL